MTKNIFGVAAIALAVAAAAFFFLKPAPVTDQNTADAGTYVEGLHYRSVAQDITRNDTIEVQEFFWYGCPHCQRFEPVIREYKETLADDVNLVQIPVTWNESTSLHAAIHYVAMEVENPEKLQDDLFEKIIAIRKEGNLEKHIDEVESVFTAHGMSAENFRSRLQSPDIKQQVEDASALMKAAEITGTPSVMVDGTWVVLNNEAVGEIGAFNVIDHLIAKARASR